MKVTIPRAVKPRSTRPAKPKPTQTASSDNKPVEAPASAGTNSITGLVTFAGGPADGRTERLPLSQLTGVTISGVTYHSRPGPPPEVKSTPQGLAQVMRPV